MPARMMGYLIERRVQRGVVRVGAVVELLVVMVVAMLDGGGGGGYGEGSVYSQTMCSVMMIGKTREVLTVLFRSLHTFFRQPDKRGLLTIQVQAACFRSQLIYEGTRPGRAMLRRRREAEACWCCPSWNSVDEGKGRRPKAGDSDLHGLVRLEARRS